MTAEIAILNKSAVALATDSAVTISSGNSHEKVFDSADKLFELSCEQPIGIMIYNGMQFSGIPLQDLIKEFRAKQDQYESVFDAADEFLKFLNATGRSAPDSEKKSLIKSIIHPFLALIKDRVTKTVMKAFNINIQNGLKTDIQSLEKESIQKVLNIIARAVSYRGLGTFFNAKKIPTLLKIEVDEISQAVASQFHDYDVGFQEQIINLSKELLLSGDLSAGRTGIVIAGLGRKERFPTLVSFEMDGVIAGKLKINWTAKCDIERGGEKAFVKPFAQKEMVERFLYGLDEEIQDKIIQYCKQTISSISDQILSQISLPSKEDQTTLITKARDAEMVFLQNLKQDAFNLIETRSRVEIEDMIQFMPKIELAKMAEALVELTSMKRKVTVGVETVGGPVDVAIISKSEGFVWIKRKHYFPPELNTRYFERLQSQARKLVGESNAK